jgi:DNA-binding beta-propeller fold protein YncE
MKNKEQDIAMLHRRIILSLIIGMVLSVLVSCAPTTYEKKQIDLVWPPPPDEPKVKYVDIIWNSASLGKKKGIADALFGEERVETFIKPYGVAVDREGKVYITDVGRIMVFDLTNKDLSIIGGLPGKGQLRVPIGIAASGDGRLFITDVGADVVYVYRGDKYVATIGQTGDFDNPSGVALDEQRRLLYVVNAQKHNVNVYSLDNYTFVRTIGVRGTADGEFNYPTNIAIDAEGNIYVVDTGNFRVQVLNADGKFIRSIGKIGDTPGSFARPKGIAIDSEGHLYVVDTAFQNIQIFDKEGRLLLYVGQAGMGPGRFQLPAGMTIDKEDRIYVVDQMPGSFQIFEYLGNKSKSRSSGAK